MNTNRIFSRGVLSIVTGLFLWTTAGCKHGPPKNTTPITETQAPVLKSESRPDVDPRERQFQLQIESMQEQIRTLTARTEALAALHRVQMGPKWLEKLQAARADASHPAERVRYLEATKALLARKLQALRSEMKVYQEFEASDPSISRQ